MKEPLMSDALMREFLLGRLPDQERERVETLFLTDTQVRDRLLAAEQDLIEDYLEDSLTKQDKERFVSIYAQTEEQLRRLRITRSLKHWAISEANQPQEPPAKVRSRQWEWLPLKPVFIIPIAATALVAIVLSVVWLSGKQHSNAAIDQELSQLNSPAALREVPSHMVSLELIPVTTRSSGSQAELSPAGNIEIVELRLSWILKENYPSYSAEVRRLGDNASFKFRNLQADETPGNTIRIRLPARFLPSGQYQVRLIGIAPDGKQGVTEEYSFDVADSQ